jgi:polar amino acid transport system substrate-binding protein
VNRRMLSLVVALSLAGLLAGCAPADEDASTDTASPGLSPGSDCSPDSMQTLTDAKLTVGTDQPAYEPWFSEDDPSNGKGFESAVAYAVAEQLGYAKDDVTWVRVPFNAAIQPGKKTFDVDINQFSITDERRQAVDFSSPYYDVRQAVITTAGSAADGVTTLDELAKLKLGAQVGTTSYDAAVALGAQPQVYNSNDDAKLALQNGQIDALVVDLPTAFYMTAAELDDGVIVGQLPPGEGQQEQFGMVLDKGSPLTSCVSAAVDALREDGTLADLESQWLADVAGAKELS